MGHIAVSSPRRDAAVQLPAARAGATRQKADEVETRVIGAVSIDAQKCSSCRMCAVFYPTGRHRSSTGAACSASCRPSACMRMPPVRAHLSRQAIAVSGRVPIKQFMGKEAVSSYEASNLNYEQALIDVR